MHNLDLDQVRLSKLLKSEETKNLMEAAREVHLRIHLLSIPYFIRFPIP